MLRPPRIPRPHVQSRYISRLSVKQPLRGGQNLTNRYQRLENSTREKYALSHNIEVLSSQQPKLASQPHLPFYPNGKVFRGFVIPEKPRPPESDGMPSEFHPHRCADVISECCMSGCAICVYDLYDDSLNTYKKAVISLRKSLAALEIPESDWPLSVRPASGHEALKRNATTKETSLDAFEAMELALKTKQEGSRYLRTISQLLIQEQIFLLLQVDLGGRSPLTPSCYTMDCVG